MTTKINQTIQSQKNNSESNKINQPKKYKKSLLWTIGACLSILISVLFFNNILDVETQNEIRKYAGLTINHDRYPKIISQIQRGNHLQSISWSLPRQDQIFIGRKNEIENISKAIKQNEKNSKLKVVVCTGLGGVGKTQLALQYAHHSKNAYSMEPWWFNARDIDTLHQEYLKYAKELGYESKPNKELIEDPATSEALTSKNNHLTTSVIDYLHVYLKNNPGWLMIFDDVQKYEDIKDFLPKEGGHILITSRHQEWPNSYQIIPLDVMTEEDSIKLIKSITTSVHYTDQNDLKELAKTLGYLPAQIACASAYIQQTKMSFREYIDLCHKDDKVLLESTTVPKGGTHNVPMNVTYNITLAHLLKENLKEYKQPLALYLLLSSAYMSSDSIPRSLLLNILKTHIPEKSNAELLLTDLLTQLHQYSMISYSDERGQAIKVHTIVQAVIRNQHISQKSNILGYPKLTLDWYSHLLTGSHAEFEQAQRNSHDTSIKKFMLPHLQSLQRYYEVLWPEEYTNINFVQTMNNIGAIFYDIGEYEQAKPYFERGLSILEKYHKDKPLTIAETLIHLGKTNRELINNPLVTLGKMQCQKAFNIIDKNLGKNNIKTADSLDCLGKCNIHLSLTHIKEAIQNFEDTLQIKKRHLGEDHPETIETYQFLGKAYRNAGNFIKAKEIHQDVLEKKKQLYGKDHIKIALILNFLGGDYTELGDPKKAKELHEQALTIQKREYGNYHPELVVTYEYLGNCYRELGDFKKSLAHHETSQKILTKIFNTKDNIYVAYNFDCRGRTLNAMSQPQEAIELHKQALKIKKTIYGDNNINRVFTLTSLGEAYAHEKIKDYQESIRHLEEVKRIYENEYPGDNNPRFAAALFSLAKVYNATGNNEKAKIELNRALKIRTACFGPTHRLTKAIEESLASI